MPPKANKPNNQLHRSPAPTNTLTIRWRGHPLTIPQALTELRRSIDVQERNGLLTQLVHIANFQRELTDYIHSEIYILLELDPQLMHEAQTNFPETIAYATRVRTDEQRISETRNRLIREGYVTERFLNVILPKLFGQTYLKRTTLESIDTLRRNGCDLPELIKKGERVRANRISPNSTHPLKNNPWMVPSDLYNANENYDKSLENAPRDTPARRHEAAKSLEIAYHDELKLMLPPLSKDEEKTLRQVLDEQVRLTKIWLTRQQVAEKVPKKGKNIELTMNTRTTRSQAAGAPSPFNHTPLTPPVSAVGSPAQKPPKQYGIPPDRRVSTGNDADRKTTGQSLLFSKTLNQNAALQALENVLHNVKLRAAKHTEAFIRQESVNFRRPTEPDFMKNATRFQTALWEYLGQIMNKIASGSQPTHNISIQGLTNTFANYDLTTIANDVEKLSEWVHNSTLPHSWRGLALQFLILGLRWFGDNQRRQTASCIYIQMQFDVIAAWERANRQYEHVITYDHYRPIRRNRTAAYITGQTINYESGMIQELNPLSANAGWLTDTTLFNLLRSWTHPENTHVVDSVALSAWERDRENSDTPYIPENFTGDIVIPLHINGNHWILGYVRRRTGQETEIFVLDSMNEVTNIQHGRNLVWALLEESPATQGVTRNAIIRLNTTSYYQGNDRDCGIFVIQNALDLEAGLTLSPIIGDVQRARFVERMLSDYNQAGYTTIPTISTENEPRAQAMRLLNGSNLLMSFQPKTPLNKSNKVTSEAKGPRSSREIKLDTSIEEIEDLTDYQNLVHELNDRAEGVRRQSTPSGRQAMVQGNGPSVTPRGRSATIVRNALREPSLLSPSDIEELALNHPPTPTPATRNNQRGRGRGGIQKSGRGGKK